MIKLIAIPKIAPNAKPAPKDGKEPRKKNIYVY